MRFLSLLSLFLGGLLWMKVSNVDFSVHFGIGGKENSFGAWTNLKGLEEKEKNGNFLSRKMSNRRQLTDAVHALQVEQLEAEIISETLTHLGLSSLGINAGQINGGPECPATVCPQFTSCSMSVKVCAIPEIVDNRMEIKPNLSSSQCPEIITGAGGKREISVKDGDILLPGCLDPEGYPDGGEEQVKEWAAKVFVLENVFLNSKGHVFNRTHFFDQNSCQWASQKFSYPVGTKVTIHSSVINLLTSTGKHLVSQKVIEKLPMLFILSPLLSSFKQAAVAVLDTKFLRTVVAPILGIELGPNALHISSTSSHILFSRRLIQPLLQHCRRPSPALWSHLRQQHLLRPEGLPILNMDWTLRSVPKLAGGQRVTVERIIETDTWVVVMAVDQSVLVERSELMVEMLVNAFGMERVVLFSGNLNLNEAKALFNRAILFIAPSGPFLSNAIFMPDNATVLELRPIPSPPSLSALSFHSLAFACSIRQLVLFCEAAASSAMILCDRVKVEDILDEIHVEVFTSEGATKAAAMSSGLETNGGKLEKFSSLWAGKMVGTVLTTENQVRKFQDWMACIGLEGHWQIDFTPRILPWSFNGNSGECDIRHVEKPGGIAGEEADQVVRSGGGPERWNVRESLKYQWVVPDGKCPWDDGRGEIASATASTRAWAAFDPRHFCDDIVARHKDGRLTLLFLGDSMSEQFLYTFMSNVLMLQKAPKTLVAPVVRPKVCEDWVHDPSVRHWYCLEYVVDSSACKGLRVVFLRNDLLLLRNPRGVFDRIPWTRLPILREADVIITNRGAHYEPDDAYVEAVQDALLFIRNRFPEKLVIYRNTPPGHKDCTNYTIPISKRQDNSNMPYDWDKFANQNVLAKPIVENAGVIYMDVDTMTALRPDGHKEFTYILDCLHYCIPGPIDLWVQYLYNILEKTLPLVAV